MHVGVDSFVSAVTDPETGRLVGPEERIEHLLEEIALADTRGRAHHPDPARQRSDGAQRRRPGPGLPAVRHP
jgi:hypothetical protein